MSMELGLEGNAALVTASSSGLGLASATELARNGADVAICGRDEDRLADAKEVVEEAADGADVLAYPADITDPDEVEALVEAAVDEFGGLDHLVTSAGGPPSTTFLETTERQWYDAYDQLVMSAVWTIENAHPHLLESDGGSIVCITSKSVRETIDGLLLSNSVRRAVIGLVKTISREFAPEIRANAVLPGTIETPRIEELIEARVEDGTYESYEQGLDAMAGDNPMGRIGEPSELGEVVAFLSSEHASYLNGIEVPIDGGSMRS